MDRRTESILNTINWDYNFSPEEIYNVILLKTEHCHHWDFEKIFIRLLERIFWYDLIYLFGVERLKKEITKSRIKKMYHPDLQKKYEQIRKILHGETVPFTEWGSEFNQRIKHTLFSNRWYSTQ